MECRNNSFKLTYFEEMSTNVVPFVAHNGKQSKQIYTINNKLFIFLLEMAYGRPKKCGGQHGRHTRSTCCAQQCCDIMI